MRISCAISSLSTGGAERVMASLANRWANAGHNVSVITLGSAASDAYPLDYRVQRIALSRMQESGSLTEAFLLNVGRIHALRRAIRSRHPDVVVSFSSQLNVLALLSCVGLGVPVVISERVHPPSHDIGTPWELLRRWTYPSAAAVVVQTAAARDWASGVARSGRVYVIPNAVGLPFVAAPDPEVRSPVVLGLGRLVAQKGFDLLIRAFGKLAHRHPAWSLRIIGEGPEEGRLKALAADVLPLRMVEFRGSVADPERHYREVALFVLPSRFEGFPNALLEAMASGCAVIAADCPAGPSEIIRGDLDGVLIPPDDVEALARAMDRLMADAVMRERLGRHAREVTGRFGADRIAPLWDAVVMRVRR